jgi:type IV pilus assembly protein PilM
MFTTTKKKTNSIVGLDIETGSIAATEVGANGSAGVARTAISPLNPGIFNEGEVQDAGALSESLRAHFADHNLDKTVRLGVANQRVVVRTLQLPLIEDEDELNTAIRFRAQDQIPMPLEQAVLDHHVVSKGKGDDGERQMEVVAVAARRDMVASLLDAMREAGLKPIGIDLSAFGMIRALNGQPVPDGEQPLTKLYCYLGDITNLAVARGPECLFTRVAPFGIESIATRIAERESMPLEEAREQLLDVGLEDPIEEPTEDPAQAADLGPATVPGPAALPGPATEPGPANAVRETVAEGTSKLIDELRVSLDYYGAQEGVPPIDQVIICGPGSTVPGLPEQIQTSLGLGIEARTPSALEHLNEEDAARLTISYGLALGED